MKKMILSLALLLAPALSFAQALPQIQEQAPGLSIEASAPSETHTLLGDQYYSYNFGSRYLHSTIYTDLTLTARGPAPVELRAINWSGTSYSVYTNCPTILYPGQTCITRVVFQPRWVGSHYSDVIFSMRDGRIIVRFYGYGLR